MAPSCLVLYRSGVSGAIWDMSNTGDKQGSEDELLRNANNEAGESMDAAGQASRTPHSSRNAEQAEQAEQIRQLTQRLNETVRSALLSP